MYGGSYYGQTYYAGRGSFTPTGIAYTATFNDTITVSDLGISRAITKAFSETVTLSDSIIKGLTKSFSETVTLSDSIIKGLTKAFSETVTLSDTFFITTIRLVTFTETVTLSDTISRAITKTLTETVTLSDTISRAITKTLTDTITIVIPVTATLSPGTMADDATVGTIAWTNPDNAKVSDDVYATVFLLDGEVTHYLKATNFGFAIPAGATINGIVAEFEVKSSSSVTTHASDSRIVKSGVIGTTNKGTGAYLSTIEAYISYGNSTDLWGEIWSPSDINASDFGFVLSLNRTASGAGSTASVDHIRITVYYTVPDYITTTRGRGKIFNDVVTITDSITRAITKIFTDTTTLSETFSKTVGHIRTFTDTITITDSITKAVTKAFSDTVTLSDSIKRYLNGELLTKWTKIVKATSSWSAVAKMTSIWTKVTKTTSDWTKSGKPDA